MENNDFKVRIIDFYKDVDKPIINNLYEDNLGKNILEFSTNNEMQILKRDKNSWKIKDQRKLLNELESVKKKKIKNLKESFNNFNDVNINDIKNKNNKYLSEIETITDLKKNLENKDNYLKLKNLSLLGTKNIKGGNNSSNSLKIIDINNNKEINIKINNILLSSESEEFIEIFSN
jgi:hypothetical protein